VGGAPEVVKRLPVRTFVDYGAPIEKDDFTAKPFVAYALVRTAGAEIHPKPGDRLPLNGVAVEVTSAAGKVITSPMSGAGQPNPACAGKAGGPGAKREEESENQRSLGIRLTFGRFTFLDVGDLPGNNLNALVCPVNLIVCVDVYLVSHHGNSDASSPAVPAAIRPRVAILNNAAR
jgi:competence protein ComEC